MANEVFVNDLEVACKAADGVSSCAFPDPCFTPSGPIPFPNTAYAKDTANGSKTVFISGKEVVLKDYSYFKTSTGNEAAKGRKGLATGDNKGKAYFRSWSMNVKIEGYNVCRHTDSMTHNHGSYSGNTGVWKYIDKSDRKKICKEDVDNVERECPTKKDKKNKEDQKANKKVTAKGALVNAIKNKVFRDDNSWKSEHCNGVLGYATPTTSNQAFDKLEKKVNEYKEIAENPMKAVNKAVESLTTYKFGWTDIIPLKWVFKGVGCLMSSGGICSEIGAMIGAALTYKELNKEKLKSDIKKEASRLKDKVEGTIKDLKEVKNLSKKEYSEVMKMKASADKCLKARKCMLVPFDKNKQTWKTDQEKNSGCCSGQTPHHIVPKSWNNCSEGEAPCVCVEGGNDSYGSHGLMHRTLNRDLNEYARANGKNSYILKGESKSSGIMRERIPTKNPLPISKKDAVELGAKSHKKNYPQCSKLCIEAQLNDFYDDCDEEMDARTIGKGVDVIIPAPSETY